VWRRSVSYLQFRTLLGAGAYYLHQLPLVRWWVTIYKVCVSDVFSAAHSIRSHGGVGRYLHGHDFRVRVCASSAGLGAGNIAVDLKLLEELLREVIEKLDHRYLNEVLGVEDLSTEYIATYILSKLSSKLPEVYLVELCSTEGRYCVEVER